MFSNLIPTFIAHIFLPIVDCIRVKEQGELEQQVEVKSKIILKQCNVPCSRLEFTLAYEEN